MTDKKKTNKRKLSTLVKQQVPEFVLTDHPKFTEFLSSYFLFMESAELNLESITDIDNIVLESGTTATNFVLIDRTDNFGLDAGDKLVLEENTTAGSFRKGEVITGATSGATATVLAEDQRENSRLFISANNAFITGETVTGGTSGHTAKVKKYRANPVENLQQLLNYSDPDHTISDFLTQMKEEFINSIPEKTDSALDRRKLIKNIQSLYRTKGTDKAHKAFFRMLFNEPTEIYKPTEDMLRVSDGKFSTDTFIRCTQTTAQSVNDPIFLVGQVITQQNNPADADINEATAIVENVTIFQEGSVVVSEIAVNNETVTGTFVNGETISGVSNADDTVQIELTVSQGLSTTTITNDGGTLTVGDEATISGGAGTGSRIQIGDISGGGVDEVLVNAAGTGYEIGDTITFSSGTAEAEIAIVGGGIAPETGNVAIHVELETGTITGSGSGDLLLEDHGDGTIGKFLDSASHETDTLIRFELENEVGHLLAEDDDNQVSDTFFILNQDSTPNTPSNLEATDHIVLENEVAGRGKIGDKIVQENASGNGDITDIRVIASGGGYTSLPTATITVGDRFFSLEAQTNRQRLAAIQLEHAVDPNGLIEFQRNDGNVLDEQETTVTLEGDGTGAGRLELEDGGKILREDFDGASATIIPYGSEIGRATSFSIIEHGINFTSAPTLTFPHYAVVKTVSGTVEADETFTSNISGATGTVVSLTAPLLKYTVTSGALEVDDTVTFSGGETAVVVKSDPVTGTTSIDTKITTAGKYINEDGHISELTKKIQDSLYYQDFSYVVKVSESINNWRDSIKRAVHPSGFYVTGEVNIASRIDGQVKQPVGASLSSGLFSGTSDSPIYMRLNTLFSTFFGRRTGVGLRAMSNGVELDGKTKVSSAVARTGIAVGASDDYSDPNTNTQKELNLSPETKMELEQRNRRSFYALNSEPFTLEDGTGFLAKEDVGNIVDEFGYTVRGTAVSNGFAYAGPRQRNLRAPFQRYAHNNGILLEGATETGNSNVKLENESGVIASEFGASASTTIADWAQLRFTGTLNTNVDGETMRFKDLEGTNSDLDHRNNFAFPTDITQEPS